MAESRLVIFDTTLRDGEQAPGFSMDVPAKLTMNPKGDGYTASFDFGDGQFQMDGSMMKAKK